jgi:hypothetical protein
MNAASFGRQGFLTSLVHEMGHVLGLWHVHRGVTEVACDSVCVETEASVVTGDLCDDTPPTPEHTSCADPTSRDGIHCGMRQYINTPFTNYMSYAR